jgi:hypothetical protein
MFFRLKSLLENANTHSVVPNVRATMQYDSRSSSGFTVCQGAAQPTYATSQYIFAGLRPILSLHRGSVASHVMAMVAGHEWQSFMTLKISHGASDGMFSQFNGWRCAVARGAGFGIGEGIVLDWDTSTDGNIRWGVASRIWALRLRC